MPGGKSSQENRTQSTTKTEPYWRAMPAIEGTINSIMPQFGNVGMTGNEEGALNALEQNAKAGNQYAPQIGLLANDLLGGGKDRTGVAQGAYDQYRTDLQPYRTMDTDPYSNQAFTKYAGLLSDDAMNRVKAQYAAAGYDQSAGTFGRSVAEGVGRAVAPVWAQERNNLESQKLGAINALYGAGNTTAGLLAGLDQQALGNRQAGVDVANRALMANDSGAARLLDVEGQRRGLPLQNIAQLESLILPLAQLGGTSNTDSYSKTTKQASIDEVAKNWASVGATLFGAPSGGTSAASGLKGWF